VLVVDDNSDAALMLAEGLIAAGYTVAVAHDGAEALRVAAEFQPDAALLDIGLPAMDGYELAQELRKLDGEGASLVIVAVTGYGAEANRQRSLEAGFDAHLVKPVEFDAVESVLCQGLLSRGRASPGPLCEPGDPDQPNSPRTYSCVGLSLGSSNITRQALASPATRRK
jgi:CheY-like chemotaxis protein